MQAFPSKTITRAYERTTEISPPRKVLVAGFCQFSDEDDIFTKDMPPQFLLDMVKYLQKKTRESNKDGRLLYCMPETCEFLEHANVKEMD